MNASIRPLILALGLALVTSGCASAPTPEQLASADYGEYPSVAQLEEAVKTQLTYPYSLKEFEVVRKPNPNWCKLPKRGIVFGYATSVKFSAKERKGGRPKKETHFIFTRNSEVIRYGKYDAKLHDRFWEDQ